MIIMAHHLKKMSLEGNRLNRFVLDKLKTVMEYGIVYEFYHLHLNLFLVLLYDVGMNYIHFR